MELVRTTAKEVQILGYEGEPYLRLDADGVFENSNSPAHYINLDRFARKPIPASASAKAAPNWVKLSDGNSIRWHDHRTHWMDTVASAGRARQPRRRARHLSGEPRRSRRRRGPGGRHRQGHVAASALADDVARDHLTGGVRAAAPHSCCCPSLRRFAPHARVAAAIASLVGSGTSTFRIVASALADRAGPRRMGHEEPLAAGRCSSRWSWSSR